MDGALQDILDGASEVRNRKMYWTVQRKYGIRGMESEAWNQKILYIEIVP